MSPQTAAARAKEKNAHTQAWIDEDPENRGAFLLVEDAAHWDEYGISTGWQLDAYLAHCEYVDLYKSVHGIKPRWTSWDDKDEAGWLVELRLLDDYINMMELHKADERRIAAELVECKPLTFNPFAGIRL